MGTVPADFCLICKGKNRPGLVILGKQICSHCEEALLRLPVGGEAYEYCKERLKLLWAEG